MTQPLWDAGAEDRARLGTIAGTSCSDIHLAWLIRMRWGAILSHVLIVFISSCFLGVRFPLLPLVVIGALACATNLILSSLPKGSQIERKPLIGRVLLTDIIFLAVLLFFSGGANNPFSIVFIVYIAMSAVAMGPLFTWVMTLLSIAFFRMLFLYHEHVPGLHMHDGSDNLDLHLHALWIAFSVVSVGCAFFLTQMIHALREKDLRIKEMQIAALKQQQLGALTTLAAGAAHELSTPLGTIEIIAGEMARAMAGCPSAILEDIELIRAEVSRCRGILEGMSGNAGEVFGDVPIQLGVASLIDGVRDQLKPGNSSRLKVCCPDEDAQIHTYPKILVQTLTAFIKNACEATKGEEQVVLTVSQSHNCVRFAIQDRGRGMSPEILARVGEPFYTTKEPGEGMGLGIFLAKLFTERVGGKLHLSSTVEGGTTVELYHPIAL